MANRSITRGKSRAERFDRCLRSEQISIVDDLAFAIYQDPEIAGIIKNLEREKQQAVQGN